MDRDFLVFTPVAYSKFTYYNSDNELFASAPISLVHVHKLLPDMCKNSIKLHLQKFSMEAVASGIFNLLKL